MQELKGRLYKNKTFAIEDEFIEVNPSSSILKVENSCEDWNNYHEMLFLSCNENEALTFKEEAETVFEDNFETLDGWSVYGNGSVELSDEISKFGTYSLKKTSNNDPNGGLKAIGFSIGRGYVFEGWINRNNDSTSGTADRLSIGDSSANGYGFRFTTGSSGTIEIERRTGGSASSMVSQSISTIPSDEWYRFVFQSNIDNSFTLTVYDSSDNELGSISSGSDTNHTMFFTHVFVHGGHNYWIDGLKITVSSTEEGYRIAKPIDLSHVESISSSTIQWDFEENENTEITTFVGFNNNKENPPEEWISINNQPYLFFDNEFSDSDYIPTTVPSTAVFADSNNEFTVETNFKGHHGTICGQAGGIGTSTSFAIYMNNGDLNVRVRGSTSNNLVESNLNPDTWYHIAVTWDGSTIKAYLNGQYKADIGIGSANNQGYNFTFATLREDGLMSNYDWFTGYIAETRIWTVARTSQEIEENYNKEILPWNEPDLLSIWDFRRKTTSTLIDGKGNHNGNILGAEIEIKEGNSFSIPDLSFQLFEVENKILWIKKVLTSNMTGELPVLNEIKYEIEIDGAGSSSSEEKIIAFTEPGEYLWTPPENSDYADVLIVAGGGGGGRRHGAGGGAGGLIFIENYDIKNKNPISLTVGSGGAGATGTEEKDKSKNGGNSSFVNFVAIGGGGGGQWDIFKNGESGGSGGGSAGASPGTGIENQGHGGGSGYTSTNPYNWGGGGGAGEPGHDGENHAHGNGGIGLNFSEIFGTNYGENGWFCGGGGGGGHNGSTSEHTPSQVTRGLGGLGGGGDGGVPNTFNQPGENATPNTGGGGGGASTTSGGSGVGGNGGSGIVLIKYKYPQIPSRILKTGVFISGGFIEKDYFSIKKNTMEAYEFQEGIIQFSIPTEGLILHLDASLEETITIESSNKISQWNDISGNNNHVYQDIDDRRPVLAEDTLYGKPTVRYNATSNVMLSTINELDLTGGYTIIFLSKNRVRRNWNGIIGFMNTLSTSSSTLEVYWQNGANNSASGNFISVFDRGGSGPTSLQLNNSLPPVNTYYVGVSAGGPLNGFLRTVGVQRDYKTGNYTTARKAKAHIGIGYASAWLDGDISEILVYDRQLEIQEIEEVEEYLTEKWLTEGV